MPLDHCYDVAHGTAAHWRYAAKLRIWTKRRFDTSGTIMYALIVKQYCIKISIYLPGREVGGQYLKKKQK